MWEPVICTGKGLVVMIANFITMLVMIFVGGGIIVLPVWWLGRTIGRMMPKGVRRLYPSEDARSAMGLGLFVCVLLAMLIIAGYETGQEVCVKGWREVFVLTASPKER